jgi:hypothetical protein
LHGVDNKKNKQYTSFDARFEVQKYVIGDYLGRENASTLIVRYHEQLLLPLLI